MKEDVVIHFDRINGSWLWSLEKGKYRAQGVQDTLEKAEQYAFEVAGNLPDVGIINSIYNPGKPIEVAKGKIKDAFVDDYIPEIFDKQED
jgi:hypothetical protein